MNSTDRDARIDALFAQAKDSTREEQQRLLAENCPDDDPAFREELQRLLAAHRAAPKQDFANRLLPQDAVVRSFEAAGNGAATEQSIAEQVGVQVGPYKLLEQIGEGGMGVVYMAEQVAPVVRRVALKVIKPGMDTGQVIARFEAERQALAMMDHPNIAKVLDAGTTDAGRPYFVMELVKGVPLTHYCDDRQMTAPQRLELFIEVCQAVAHAHQKGMIHRDIKPSNVMVAEYDHRAVPKIIDFGVAKAAGQRLTEKTLFTQYGQLVGTIEYMSPEQAKFNQLDVDTRSDVYSLGVLLYELLSGATPFDEKRLRSAAFDEMLRIIREEEPPRPSARLSASDILPAIAANRRSDPEQLTRLVRGDLDWIVMKALAKERDDRYPTILDLSADIRRHLDDKPIEARGPSTVERVRKFVRRRRLPVALAASACVALATVASLGAIALFERQTAEREQQINQVSQWSADARNFQETLPIQSTLLGIQAVEFSRQHNDVLLPLAHETLLNVIPSLAGQSLTAPGSTISDIAIGSNGLVSLGKGQPTVTLWSLKAQDPASSSSILNAVDDSISDIAVSDDGRWLITAGSKLQRWDLEAADPSESSQELSTTGIDGNSLGLSANGRWIIARDVNANVTLWDAESPAPPQNLGKLHGEKLEHTVVSPDGRWAAFQIDGVTIELWDIGLQSPASAPRRLALDEAWVWILTISPDGRWLFTGQTGGFVHRWDLHAEDFKDPNHTFHTNQVGPRSAAVSPDGRWLFTGGEHNSEIFGWDLASAEEQSSPTIVLDGHSAGVTFLATSRDGRWLISAGFDGAARVWDLNAADPNDAPRVLKGHNALNRMWAGVDLGGRWVVTTASDGTTRLWDLDAADPEASPFVLECDHCVLNRSSAISSDGRWIAAGSTDHSVRLWDLEATDPSRYSRTLAGRESGVSSLVISPDDRWLVATSPDNVSLVWDLNNDDPASSRISLGVPTSGANEPPSAVIDATSTWLATRGDGGDIQLWDLTAEVPADSRRVLHGHESPVWCITASPDGRWLVTGSHDDPVRLWDMYSEDVALSARVLNGVFVSFQLMAIDAASRWLAIAHGSAVTLIDLKASDPASSQRTIPAPQGLTNPGIFKMLISPDARRLFTSRFDGTAQIWDLTEENPAPRSLRGHRGVQSAAITPGSRWLVTGNRLGNAQLWDLNAPDIDASLRVLRGHTAPIWSMRISANSQWLVTVSSDNTIRRWNLDIDWLLDYARKHAGRD